MYLDDINLFAENEKDLIPKEEYTVWIHEWNWDC